MERRIPIEWLIEWAKITDNEELVEVIVGDWTREQFEKPYCFSEDKVIRDDVVLRTYNNDGQFDAKRRRHYSIDVFALDYDDEGNNPVDTILVSDIKHFSKKELEEYAVQQATTKLGDHAGIYVYAEPNAFIVAETFHNEYIRDELQKNTKVSEDGQIGFKL